jgi:hypothetical protein
MVFPGIVSAKRDPRIRVYNLSFPIIVPQWQSLSWVQYVGTMGVSNFPPRVVLHVGSPNAYLHVGSRSGLPCGLPQWVSPK